MTTAGGPVAVQPVTPPACEAWQVTEDNIRDVAHWGGAGHGSADGVPCVWIETHDEDEWADHGLPAVPGQWVVKREGDPTLVLSPEAFAAGWLVVPS